MNKYICESFRPKKNKIKKKKTKEKEKVKHQLTLRTPKDVELEMGSSRRVKIS